MNRKWDKATAEVQRKCLDEVITRVEEIEGDTVGVIAAQDIVDIVLENLAPAIYDAGLADAQRIVSDKLQDIDTEIELLRQA